MVNRRRTPVDPVYPVFNNSSSSRPDTSPTRTESSDSINTPSDDFDRLENPQIPPEEQPKSIVDILPYTILCQIFIHLDAAETVQLASMGHLASVPTASTQQWELTCKLFKQIADDPYVRHNWLITRYGRQLGLFYAFKYHKGIFSPEVGRLMLRSRCQLPRYLIQLVDKEYHLRPDRLRRPVSLETWMFFIQNGYQKYQANADFREDDVARFERCLYGVTTTVQESIDIIKNLTEVYGFVPVRGMGSPVDETVYLVSKLDVNLVTGLERNGLDLSFVNDSVMEKLLWRSDITESIVASYVRVGFKLTGPAVKKGLQMGRANTLEILRKYIIPPALQSYAEDTVVDMFGPAIRGWNFTLEAIDFLRSSFTISEDVMERAILRHPNGISPDSPDAFPATRSYMKANPCPVWRWILRVYGPTHRLTMACFDDAISRAAAERELHALHDIFLNEGVQFRPRHVKILACRVLHRDMTANALHLLQIMRKQIITAARLQYDQSTANNAVTGDAKSGSLSSSFSFIFGSGMSSSGLTTMWNTPNPETPTMLTPGQPTFEPLNSSDLNATRTSEASADLTIANVTPMTPELRQEWINAFQDEVTGSDEWKNRMETTQLEGGPRGGAFRITRPPEDAVRFLEESKEIVAELNAFAQKSTAVLSKGNASGKSNKVVHHTKGRSTSVGASNSSRSTPPRSMAVPASIGSTSSRSFVGRRSSAPGPVPTSQPNGSSTNNLSSLTAEPEQEREVMESNTGSNLIPLDTAVVIDMAVQTSDAEDDNIEAAEGVQSEDELAVDDDSVTVTPADTNPRHSPTPAPTPTPTPTNEEMELFTAGFRIHGTSSRDAVVTLDHQPRSLTPEAGPSTYTVPQPPRPSSSQSATRPRIFRRMSAFWTSLRNNRR
ncbi:hypothetical protein HDU79_001740 [Rhizoclosmatium sp. JEL0117]|nr:hypothetical protein HDU79_001740 [Rhizoclosmatium sp. JEL0117]